MVYTYFSEYRGSKLADINQVLLCKKDLHHEGLMLHKMTFNANMLFLMQIQTVFSVIQ